MSDQEFKDYERDDSYSDEAPDAEAVARFFHGLRQLDPNLRDWEDLSDDEQAIGVDLVGTLVARLRREGGVPPAED